MTSCIVCNQQTMPDDKQDGHTASLCARLEKVLDEAVPQEAVMCSSCQCDLSQIEMYYTLLTVFKKRYSETAKLRLERQTHETRRNLLNEIADSSSSNSQTTSGAKNVTDDFNTHLPLQCDALKVYASSETFSPGVKLEIHDVRLVKDELPGDKSVPMESKSLTDVGDESGVKSENIQDFSSHTDILHDSGVGPTVRKRGRPRKKEQSNVVSSVSSTKGRKRGRPRKNVQLISSPPEVVTKGLKKRGRPRKDRSSELAQTLEAAVQKAGQLRNNELSRQSTPIYYGESESEVCSVEEGDSDETETDDPEYYPKPSPTVTRSNLGSQECVTEEVEKKTGDPGTKHYEAITSIDGGTTGRPKKGQGPSYVAPVVQKKRGRPKKTEEDPHPTHACTLCNKLFISSSRLKAHKKTHLSDRPFVCSICSKAFRGIGDLNAHMKYHTADRPFKCDLCGKGFLRKLLLERHLVVHSDSRPFQCDQCERKFKSPQHLKHHTKCHHVDGKKYLCNLCGLALFTEGSLRNHMKTHSEARPFTCETCGRGFSTKAYLLNHEPTHNADTREKYLCPVCGKEFLQKSYLPLHMRQHTGESKYICCLCDKSFSASSTYKRHMLIHSGEKPHRCSECGKGFVSKGNLTVHMMSHTDERPFKCVCGQGFRSGGKMRRHMRTNKHGECGEKPVATESLNRQVPHAMSTATSVPVATPFPILEPISMSAPFPLMGPLPIVPSLTVDDQHEVMSDYQTGPL